MSEPDGLRISDADRERASAELREHFAHGRLDADELSERLDHVYAARTAGELQAVRSDLPALPASRAQTRAELAERRAELSRHLVQQTGASLAPFLVCALIWVLSGASGSFWPAWVALVAVIPLVRNLWRLYGPAPDLESVSKELADRSGRRRHHRAR